MLLFYLPFILFTFSMFAEAYHHPHKLPQNYDYKIVVEDKANVLGNTAELRNSLVAFYNRTGISPAVITVENSDWQGNYSDLENYAYDLYVNHFADESHWLIVYSTPDGYSSSDGFEDWYWEPRYCAGTHIHISADDYTPQQIRNLVNIFASKEDFLWDALQVSSARESYCHKMDKQFIEEINRKKPKDMEEIKGLWYHGRMSEQFQHYSNSRYVICNLHSFFQHGHYEIRAYNGSLHAGEVRSQIVLALAISNAAMTKKYCSPHVSQSDNMRYSFRVWLLNLGLIGDEFKNCRTHLLKHLDGDIAWRHPEDGIAARAKLKEKREAERQAVREQRVEPVSEVQELNENVPDEISEPSESECGDFVEYEGDEEMGMEMSM